MRSAPTEASDVVVRAAAPGDERELAAAFERAFAEHGADAARRGPAEWRWRAREHPLGTRAVVAVTRDGAIVAHFGAWPVRVRFGGERLRTAQAIDVFVAPEARRGLWRARVYERLVAAYVERHCGERGELDRLAWGLPTERAWRLGRARAGYQRIDALWWLVAHEVPRADARANVVVEEIAPRDGAFAREDAAGRDRVVSHQGELEREERAPACDARALTSARATLAPPQPHELPADVDALLERLAGDAAARGEGWIERDRALLAWRFLRRPGVPARVVCARRRGELAGLAIWRAGAVADRRGALVLAWLVPRDDDEAARALLARLAERAAAAQALPLVALAAACSPELGALQRAGLRVSPAQHFLAGRAFDRAWPIARWARALPLQLGDTDLA